LDVTILDVMLHVVMYVICTKTIQKRLINIRLPVEQITFIRTTANRRLSSRPIFKTKYFILRAYFPPPRDRGACRNDRDIII